MHHENSCAQAHSLCYCCLSFRKFCTLDLSPISLHFLVLKLLHTLVNLPSLLDPPPPEALGMFYCSCRSLNYATLKSRSNKTGCYLSLSLDFCSCQVNDTGRLGLCLFRSKPNCILWCLPSDKY